MLADVDFERTEPVGLFLISMKAERDRLRAVYERAIDSGDDDAARLAALRLDRHMRRMERLMDDRPGAEPSSASS